jgi:glycosyltransferase involved in cell wall biosynthesis
VNLITQIVSWGSTSWLINPDDEDGLIREIMGRSREVKGPADVSVQVQLPNEWDSQLARYNIGVSAVVETDICNPQWITACNQMDHIVVPSNHAKSTLDRTGQVEKPVSVIPESFFEQISNPDLQPLDLDIKTKFNFLVVGQITGNNPQNDRKNLFKTLKWLCEAFAKDPDVGVILKTNSGRGTSIDRKITQKLVNDLVNEIRPGPFPRIHLLHGNLTKEEMASVYRIPSVKAFVSLTRGEGYGLPLLEAAASDIPVIATNWSGHLDFLGKGRFIPVNYVLQPIDKSRVDGQIFIPGSKWAEVLEKDFKKKVKKFRENPDTPTDWAKSLGETVRREFSQSSIEEIYTRELGSYIK